MGSPMSKKYPFAHMSRLRVPKYDLNNFAVVTVVFNPIRYRSRSELYHKFDEHMSRSGVTLLTVECIFDCPIEYGLPQQRFEITREKDPRHLQVVAPSVLWLKENLINIAMKRLPDYIEYVAWLDADIEFTRLDWPHLTIHQLQQYPIVQMFEMSSFLGPSGKKQILRQDFSFAYAIRHQMNVDPRRVSECFVHPGYGWAMRRATFESIGGLLEFSILGSGDIHFAFSLINRIEETIPAEITDDYRQLARAWGQQVAQIAKNGSAVGYVPVDIRHYWHGNRVNRGYFERWKVLENFQFSPIKHLEKNGQTGLLRLSTTNLRTPQDTSATLTEFQQTIISYFRSRDEDNTKRAIPAINLKHPPKIPLQAKAAIAKPKFTDVNPNNAVRSSPNPNPYASPFEILDPDRIYDDNSGYIPVRDDSSFHLGAIENDSFFEPSPNNVGTMRYYPPGYAYPKQNIYYDDAFGNARLSFPEEISF